MSKCLITKLNGSSTNDDLLKIGEMVLDVQRSDQSTTTMDSNDNDAVVSIVTPGIMLTKNGVQTQTAVLDGQSINFPAGTYRVRISNKYSINTVNASPAVFPLDELKFAKNIYRLTGSFSGNLSDIACNQVNYTELIDLQINWSNDTISGDIAVLCPFTKLTGGIGLNSRYITGNLSSIADIEAVKNGNCTSIWIENADIFGTIEDLVANLRTKKGQTGKLTLKLNGCSRVTFGTHTASEFDNSESSLEWTSNSVFYSNSTQVYAKGASSSQISDWKNAGKTVYEIS